ncbi:uncharacterized protein DSM5745_10952 [Aspergillus mulundensis]|uniref:Uncharacterized protein n=1 Tax=Aspergillus mulundensis TaxID=1810919 RepID=A0A3D8QGE8_9EURO|nr:hypothetical protein DSM5745_10952 [Aspergillus mulundensis]RDW60494.1 hypothetical protein DSM5745_10952 [Aspergillus mulundensis]
MPTTLTRLKATLTAFLANERFKQLRRKAHRLSTKDTHWSDLEYPCITAQHEWISEHLELESRGLAILQRISRLESKSTTTASDNDVNATVQGSKKEPREDTRLTVPEKATLLNTFIKIQQVIKAHLATIPPGNTTAAFEIDSKNLEPGTGRRAQWFHGRRLCAERGGCCARGCGCCERPVTKYIEHLLEDGKGRWTTVPLYGHCTAECGCCIRERGVYEPDKRIPDAGVVKGI